MEYEVKMNRKTFKVNADFHYMLTLLTNELDNFQHGYHIIAETEDLSTEQEYKDDINAAINYIKTLQQMPMLLETIVVDKIAKKKDGWFAKGRVTILFRCDHTAYLSEEEYGYRCLCIKAKSTSAGECDLFVSNEIFKW